MRERIVGGNPKSIMRMTSDLYFNYSENFILKLIFELKKLIIPLASFFPRKGKYPCFVLFLDYKGKGKGIHNVLAISFGPWSFL